MKRLQRSSWLESSWSFFSIRDLQDALTNFQSVANYCGSASLQQFAHAARGFLDTGPRQLHMVDSDASTLLQWYDNQFQHFWTELFLYMQQHRDPPRHVVTHDYFDPSGTRFNTLLLRLSSARSLASLPSSLDVKAEIHAQNQADLASNSRKPQRVEKRGVNNTPVPPMPKNVQRLIPKQKAVPCCLRALWKTGHNSKLKDDHCGSSTFKKCLLLRNH